MNHFVIASGPVIVEDGKVLLNKHGEPPLKWKFCGGRVETMEHDLREAARREAREEIGVELELEDQPPFLMYTSKPSPEGTVDVLLVRWLAKRVGDIKPGEDIEEVKWLDLATIADQTDLSPNILPTLKHFGFIA
ncbi:MAG: NUDIX domain-containing protein [Patescibacteria group bacterium]